MEQNHLVAKIQVRIFATVFYVIIQLIRMNMKEMIRDIDYSNMRDMLKDCICEVQERVKYSDLPGISSGFEPLDNLTGGFEDGKVYVVGGRPSMGKEELMLTMMLDISMKYRVPVLMFSTNHRKPDYVQRLLSIQCNIPISRLPQGFLEPHEWDRLDKNVNALVDAPLFVHDRLDLPLNELIETARYCVKENGARIIFIDCLQMIDFANEDENASDRLAKVMCSLKQLACFLDMPIVVGSMLDRSIEHRKGLEGKQPQLMDLEGSGYIEEFADVVMMVHRPEVYHIFQDERGRDFHGKMEILLRKNNLKPLGSILLDYHQDTGVVSFGKSDSKAVSQKALKIDNKAIKKLKKDFDLKEELPF